ncbi:hypothetical protein FISHEDRAFT_74238 [Fistulina hepatica ATCC 64428]|uniref:Uncharacterized protein n=1 Tax=Fistulina hepatica ATCC 64428 TaxID=1128425 RepID=A0A0D7AB75_9AGAR|nr:hypothetical protein FISHEDRAFT_74238 [Fistulina hepatica ATCC 64428]
MRALTSPGGRLAKDPLSSLPPPAAVQPRLVYRTGTTPWKKPTGPEAYRELRELRPVFGHKIIAAWKRLGPKVVAYLDSVNVLFTSIDCVRFAKVRDSEGKAGPVVLWIGVIPKSLSGEDAHTAGHGCLALLREFDITDVDVEFRESIYTRSTGPKLLKPVCDLHPTVDVRGPLTPALGLPIAALDTPYTEGTGGFYISEGGDSNKVFVVTARHVVFPLNAGSNDNYVYPNTSTPRRRVLLLGTTAFNNFVTSIKVRIARHSIMGRCKQRQLEALKKRGSGEDKDDVEDTRGERKKLQSLSDEASEAMDALDKFHDEVTKYWSHESQRILGHVVRSPPITLGAGTDTEGYTEDYAIVELDSSKIDKSAFRGNVIDLGTKIPVGEFGWRMRAPSDAPMTFEYPLDRLLKLEDYIKEEEMHHPNVLDHNGEECLLVIKSGNTTDVTIGCATGVFSYVREYLNDGTHQTSMEWAILPYDYKSGAFSAPGDSGSIIVDGRGRFGGLLTGGAGNTEAGEEELDITYATPFFWLWSRIKANGFPDAHLHPVMA